eukprot:44903-Eustigmatos_ZCMA.PRE.1
MKSLLRQRCTWLSNARSHAEGTEAGKMYPGPLSMHGLKIADLGVSMCRLFRALRSTWHSRYRAGLYASNPQ